MQLQTLFAIIISLQTRMRGSHSRLPFTIFLLLADARHQLRQSSYGVYLVPHLHSLSLSQHTPVMPLRR